MLSIVYKLKILLRAYSPLTIFIKLQEIKHGNDSYVHICNKILISGKEKINSIH